MSVIYIPAQTERNPLWKFEGEWLAEEAAIVETVMRRHDYKQKKCLVSQKLGCWFVASMDLIKTIMQPREER